MEADSSGILHLKASQKSDKDPGLVERSVDLKLIPERPPLVHGKGGVSPKSAHPGHASHYYSLTRLRAEGSVTIDGKSRSVKGIVWFDHEWATNSLDPEEAGWDWSGLHLSNGTDLMIFRIRDKEGRTVFTSGTLREASGTVIDLHDLTITPKGIWKSPHTKGNYPASMEVSIPSRNILLSLTPSLRDQELVLPPFAYWEGAVRASGSESGRELTGEGYLELTGYGGRIMGVNGK
jgi:predicted secreted hydrolase